MIFGVIAGVVFLVVIAAVIASMVSTANREGAFKNTFGFHPKKDRTSENEEKVRAMIKACEQDHLTCLHAESDSERVAEAQELRTKTEEAYEKLCKIEGLARKCGYEVH